VAAAEPTAPPPDEPPPASDGPSPASAPEPGPAAESSEPVEPASSPTAAVAEAAPSAAGPEGEPEPAPPVAEPAPAAAASGGGLPTRDELTVAWGDSVLASLPPRAKAFFSAGRFVEVTDRAAVFGLPNAVHMQKCENGRADVEQALTAHFGRPVPLLLAVDGDSPAPVAPVSPGSSPRPPAPDDDEVDPTELTDADVGTSSVDRVRELFPGAELVDPS